MDRKGGSKATPPATTFRLVLGDVKGSFDPAKLEKKASTSRAESEPAREKDAGRSVFESSLERFPPIMAESPAALLGAPPTGGATIRAASEMDAQLQFVKEVRWELDANGMRTGVHLRVENGSLNCSVELRSRDGEINLGALQSGGGDLPRELQERIEERLLRAGLCEAQRTY